MKMKNYQEFQGVVTRGFGIASGRAMEDNPFGVGVASLDLQNAYYPAEVQALRKGYARGTINLLIDREVILSSDDIADYKCLQLKWIDTDKDGNAVGVEDFFFIKATLIVDGNSYEGLLYYPHPRTKPATNKHHYDRLEWMGPEITDIKSGKQVLVKLTKPNVFCDYTLPKP